MYVCMYVGVCVRVCMSVADPGGGLGGLTPPPPSEVFFLFVSIWKFPRTWTLTPPPFEEFWPRTPPPFKEFLDPPLYVHVDYVCV